MKKYYMVLEQMPYRNDYSQPTQAEIDKWHEDIMKKYKKTASWKAVLKNRSERKAVWILTNRMPTNKQRNGEGTPQFLLKRWSESYWFPVAQKVQFVKEEKHETLWCV